MSQVSGAQVRLEDMSGGRDVSHPLGADMSNGVEPLDPVKLGVKFACLMSVALTAEQLQEVNERNKASGLAGSLCASHDFLDANMIMLEAIESFGHDLEPDSEEQAQVMDTAWKLAKRALFDEKAVTAELLQNLYVDPPAPVAEASLTQKLFDALTLAHEQLAVVMAHMPESSKARLADDLRNRGLEHADQERGVLLGNAYAELNGMTQKAAEDSPSLSM